MHARRVLIVSTDSAIISIRASLTSKTIIRKQSTHAQVVKVNGFSSSRLAQSSSPASTGLERLSTSSLMRNLLLGMLSTSPVFFNVGISVMQTLAESKWSLLNPDKNPILRMMLKPLVYDQFCAGTDRQEIYRTRDEIKSMGYSGVILCYGKEVQVKASNVMYSTGTAVDQSEEIKMWRDGNLRTLHMVGAGDWIGIKFSGAGYGITEALVKGQAAPLEFTQAMDAICEQARSQDCRIWIDAEQQVIQKTIDDWTINLMRKYNVNGKALVYNTLQAYLKASRTNFEQQMALSAQEGWTLAIKLVRGAYIANDQRSLIHDTKQDTDDSYNGIVRDILIGSTPRANEAPPMQVFLAGHNPESIRRALSLIESLSATQQLKVLPDFGQLQGMSDGLGCEFLKHCESLQSAATNVPRIYRCLTWGSIQECMQYLLRRLVENRGGADRMRDGLPSYINELKRRLLRRDVA